MPIPKDQSVIPIFLNVDAHQDVFEMLKPQIGRGRIDFEKHPLQSI